MKTLYISYFGAMKPLVQTQVIPYLKHLVHAGIGATLMTFEEALDDPKEEERQRARIRSDLAQAGIAWHPLRYHKRPSLPATMYDVCVGTAVATYLVRRDDIDVVHARNHIAGLMGLAVKRLLGTKLLFDQRGVLAEEYVDAGHWREGGIPYRLVKSVERELFEKSDAIVMLTERIRSILIEKNASLASREVHIEVIPCCADLTHFAVADRAATRTRLGLEDKKVLVYAGSTGSWYMLEEMADFAATAAARYPHFHFLVLSQSPHAEIATTLTNRGLVPTQFTIVRVDPRDMPNYLAAADMALSFIRPTFSKISSSPTKIGEYLAAGLPLVTNAGIGDIDGLVRDENVGVLLDTFSPTAYTRALDELDALVAEGGPLPARCRRVAEAHFSLHSVGGPRYERVYDYLRSENQRK